MNRILNYTISDADAGMIVLDFLRKQGFSRHILTAMKADKEALSVNDQKSAAELFSVPVTIFGYGFWKLFPLTALFQRLWIFLCCMKTKISLL